MNEKVSAKALTAWIGCAMLGVVALAAARSGWLGVALTGVLCGLLCVTVHAFSDSRPWENPVYCGILLLFQIVSTGVVAAQGAICLPGKGADTVVPLVLLLLAAASAWGGGARASRVSAVLCPLCVAVFAVVTACGIGSIRWERVAASQVAPGGMLIFVFLLPIAATAIPRETGSAFGKCLTGVTAFGALVSVVVTGVLSEPIALVRPDSFYEFSRSISLFSGVHRFEAVTAVAVTVSIYAMLSLLLSGAGHLGEVLYPGSYRWAVLAVTVLAGGLGTFGFLPEGRTLAVCALAVWGILPILMQFLPCGKKAKKEEKTP